MKNELKKLPKKYPNLKTNENDEIYIDFYLPRSKYLIAGFKLGLVHYHAGCRYGFWRIQCSSFFDITNFRNHNNRSVCAY